MMVPSALAGSYRGKLVTIGVAAPERHEAFKEVSTLTEQGVSIDSSAWIALVGPPKMPAPIADTIHKAVQEVLHDPEVQKRLRESGMTPHIATRVQFESYLAKEYGRWGEVVREAKITVDE
jgi:tripartite-type tricarboxylate transporter receptor subunit TctC